jgi:hypothetical protein
MKELSIERMELVNGGGCSFEEMSALVSMQLVGLGMYAHTGDYNWLFVVSGATLAMSACM